MIRLRSLRFLAAAFALFASTRALPAEESASTCKPVAPSAGKRMTVIISDLHMGLGRVGNPLHWHPYEDFRWTDEFGRFLLAIDTEGARQVDLVLNGDSFELWQSSLEHDCVHDDRNQGCSEDEALARANEVLAAHHDDLVLLRDFACRGSNRVFFVPGNHDAALLYGHVEAALLTAIGAPGHVWVLRQGYWLSDDGWIYAEHGHQIDEMNKFTHWPTPFIAGTPQHLEKPWGEQFVHSFYDHYEAKYPIIDNIEGELNGIRYGLASEGLGGSIYAVGRFVKFFAMETSIRQFSGSLETGPNPPQPGEVPAGGSWNITAIRKQGDSFFLDSIAKEDPIRPFVADEIQKHPLGTILGELRDEEITDICDNRAALIEECKRDPACKPPVSYCPAAAAHAVAHALTDPQGRRVLSAHLAEVRQALPIRGKPAHPFSVAVISHTHKALDRFDPNEGKVTSWHPDVLNTGAWQRIVTRERLETIRGDHLSFAQVLEKLQLEDLPPCYPAVVIPPYEKQPDPKLRYWQRNDDGRWAFALKCPKPSLKVTGVPSKMPGD